MVSHAGNEMGLAIAGFWRGDEKDASHSRAMRSRLFGKKRFDGFEDTGEYLVMDASYTGEVCGMVDKYVFEKGIGR
jgi:hypothetical protein